MTKNQAVTLSRELVANKHKKFYDEMMQTEPPTIAQSIRDAAINWPQFLGDVECGVIDAFCYPYQTPYWQSDLRRYETNQARTFMLLVAEALE